MYTQALDSAPPPDPAAVVEDAELQRRFDARIDAGDFIEAKDWMPELNTATVTRYAEIATLTSTASTPNDAAINGMAGAMIVASRISMNSAPATSSAIPRGNGGFTVRLPRR